MPTATRARPPRDGAERPPRRPRSDLLARILVALPAALVAIVFVDLGGLAFALFLVAIGILCMHELYRMLGRWRPLPLVGFASLAGMVLAARYGHQRAVLGAAVAALPVAFILV